MAFSFQDLQFPDLKDSSVFITGGGSGIGAALTEGFLSQGARVAFVGLSDATPFCDEMETRYGIRPLFIRCDIRDIEALRSAIADARDAHGPIKVLVNNAARDTRHSLAEWSVADWDDSIATNLRPQFFTAQAVAADMREQGGGAIINLSSNSYLLGLAGYPTYVTAKAGIMGMTKALARELGPDNIRVNCLIPGWVMTERQRELWVNDKDLQECLDQQCLKEAIPVEDMIGPCLFLASEASRMMTGQELVVDGGRV
ncbi:NAD(P)-dependent dehydrogenase, short-chain alcohol dehydrogenase family [Modicisalibacter ilicicola DSM 19980]|uniref:NAD(P)-dependent dehydrogenase, short-chain alcohol dehydrogenase family n=1 Tax=Modicisalibacter ilicicola DSM 19980 TaxID=1121942 RepID=A0A1M4U7N3_9GAMM|nr:SDR family oxidoreductase [Halomonas ilicicola]SHE52782.1 NAD(P)-dependent dehydrogenase, short-chain alcohol dehydrogenase family [Halomonas ilicicola DSM 19980]